MFGVLDDLAQSASDFFAPAAPATSVPSAPAHHGHHGHHGHHAQPESTGSIFDVVAQQIGAIGADVGHAIEQEGGVPYAVVADRVSARQELANRFTVTSGNHHGRRAPNTVTEEEYLNITRLYSDIRMGRGDLTLDGGQTQTVDSMDPTAPGQTETAQLPPEERDTWRAGVMNDIATVLQTRVGREELGLLSANANHHHTTIGPHMMAASLPDSSNALALPTNAADAIMRPDGTANAGSDVHVHINHGDRIYAGEPDGHANPWMGSMRSDVTLLHELTHALYGTMGLDDNNDIKPTDDAAHPHSRLMARDAAARVDGQEVTRGEHQAVAIGTYGHATWGENRYRKERLQMAHAHGAHHGTGHHDSDAEMTLRDSYAGLPAHHHHRHRHR